MLAAHADTADRTGTATRATAETSPETAANQPHHHHLSSTGPEKAEDTEQEGDGPGLRNTDTQQEPEQKQHGIGGNRQEGIDTVSGTAGIGENDNNKGLEVVVEEKQASMIRAQMSVLMLGFYEIVRQVGEGLGGEEVGKAETGGRGRAGWDVSCLSRVFYNLYRDQLVIRHTSPHREVSPTVLVRAVNCLSSV